MRAVSSFLLLLTFFIISSLAYTKVDKFSTEEALDVLSLLDKIGSAGADEKGVLLSQFREMTSMDYSQIDLSKFKAEVHQTIIGNDQRIGFFSKMVGLMSFQSLLLTLMVIVAVALVFSFLKDLMLILGVYIGFFLYKIILSKGALYVYGYVLSFITLYFKADEIENPIVKYLFIFDRMTPLFGCIIFYITVVFSYTSYLGEESNLEKDRIRIDITVTIIWAINAIYHQNSMIGCGVVMVLFKILGFSFGSIHMGHYVGFDREKSIKRCTVISIILNVCMILAKKGIYFAPPSMITKYFLVFESAVFSWATIVGAVAMLIQSNEFYLKYRYGNNYAKDLYLRAQIVMVVYCLLLLYLGNVLYITSYLSIGGTIMFLWALDLQRALHDMFKNKSTTIILLILLGNLYGLYRFTRTYPQYFIL